MARMSFQNVSSLDQTSVDLGRMVARFQQSLLLPDSKQEARLRDSRYEREKVGNNIEHARALLVQLEQDAQNIKIQARKQNIQRGLIEKREVLQRLGERLQEFNELVEIEISPTDFSEDEDLLGEDTPSDTTDEHLSPADNSTTEPTDSNPSPISSPPVAITQAEPVPPPSSQPTTTTSTLRARNPRSELFSSHATGTSTSTSPPTTTTATTETLLTHNRAEQESLTNSLLSMASALKSSSQAFASSLEEEKSVLDNAVTGMDKNESGLQQAQKRMGVLRKYSEGKGWWGRMILYAWIGGLWVVALVVVFVLPKLRF